MPSQYRLVFEKEIYEAEAVLAKLEATTNGQTGSAEEIRRMRRELNSLIRRIYVNLTAWQTVQVARHQERPQFLDYVELIFDEFVELHGDRAFGDDRAIRSGFARLGDFKVMLIGHHKGRNLKERTECFYGCAHPEGYRKALNRMKLAAKFHDLQFQPLQLRFSSVGAGQPAQFLDVLLQPVDFFLALHRGRAFFFSSSTHYATLWMACWPQIWRTASTSSG